jgi:hypothetical protein
MSTDIFIRYILKVSPCLNIFISDVWDSLYFDGPRAERPWLDIRQRQEIFLYSTASRPALGPTKPSIQWVAGSLSPGVKQPGREADHSIPTSAEVKNGGATPQFPIRLRGAVLNCLIH